MPELPEVEAMVRRLGEAVTGSTVASAVATPTGVSALRSFDPPLDAIVDTKISGLRRRGKHLIVDFDNDLSLLIHLMSAGRFQIFDKPGSVRDRTGRIFIRLQDGRELRLREFGTKHSAWAKLLTREDLEAEPEIETLGPEAWPDPPRFDTLLRESRPLHAVLRDQRVIAGIGRSWVDEILHRAKLSPFKRGDTLTPVEAKELRRATIDRLGMAIEHYEREVTLPLPDKFPMPLTVHRHVGEPCQRCGTILAAVHFEDHVMTYCPACQTGGKLLKDRRLSRLLK